ncbi:copper-(or silver)-translocating P-type ATPase [Acetitomaculum ruminis DSM 5522]|uniref:Cd(2+)-exporting ATPase n=1 Tax=Acetitomaculum ruminis DSM 5522 TaxID=1120918 RepID=A0A1I1A9D1_9FIRM|nr:cation-translocating P-type ATPase [Acetitomaculum ruminis]SFB34581.1 copper-(or silver)-translocating P-type ATPase [Acetitomaculum ruminis DSM 5522]
MLKKFFDFLSGWQMTILGGIFLIVSFILPRTGYVWGENFAWICIFICGLPLLYLAIYRLFFNKGISKISSCLLISTAMIAAILIGDLFAAGEVAFIMEIGAILEDITTKRAKKGLKNLMDLTPVRGRIIKNKEEIIVPVEKIKKDDLVRILPGETIPVDGLILRGESSIDQSAITGESLPVDKGPGESVFSGTINCFGSIDIRTTKVGKDSSLQKLISLVEEAEKKQAPTARIADKWASILVPVALLIAIAAFIVTGNIIRAVTVMVVFCPCALVLATPTAIMAAIGQATKKGIVIKSGQALENMGKAHTIAFDKTGTITYGKLEVSDIISFSDMSEDNLLQLASSAESKSEHPLGKAICNNAKKKKLSSYNVTDFKMSVGKGISCFINKEKYLLVNEKFIRENNVFLDKKVIEYLDFKRLEGKASIIISDSKKVLGVISLSDILRPESKKVIEELKQLNCKPVLLTGDNEKSAKFFANKAGITEVYADLLPNEKVENILNMRKSSIICMIGDGVNDAPALKTADVGIAMGVMGSDIAIDASDIALMTDDISKLPYLKWLSTTTVKTIKSSITLSMSINFFAIILSVTGYLNPTSAALVHNAGSCLVVLLAALLYDKKYKVPQKESYSPLTKPLYYK